MRAGALVLLSLAALAPAPPASAAAPEALLAADAAVYAPPDLKRQIVRHRARLMQGVADAGRSAAEGTPGAHRAAALRQAREIVRRIRGHARFADVAYDLGALVHECAAIGGLPSAAPARATFLGFSPDPFRDPDAILGVPEGTDRWTAALTRATRLIAWVWKSAGGDASIALRMPEAKGPYAVREQQQ